MKTRSHPRPRSLRAVASATSAALGLVLGTVVLATSATSAVLPQAMTPITDGNPLAGASGFTVLSFGNLELGNHEIEGSVAAGGNISVSAGPFNIIHSAAGSSDYTLPALAGSPIRLVAGGTFDTVRSGNQRIQVTSGGAVSADQHGQIRLGGTTTTSVSGRQSGVCVQTAGVSDCSVPALEQSSHTQTVASVTDPAAYSTLVTAGDQDALAQWSLAIAGGQLLNTHEVTWPTDLSNPMNGIAVTLVAGTVNVLNIPVAALPTTAWKLAFAGAAPSATTTLVINIVDAPDGASITLPMETIGAYSSPGSSKDNNFARYMLWNIDQPKGATIKLDGDGIVPGSVLAPRSIVLTGPTKTLIEGQIVGAELQLKHSGEVHHYAFLGELEIGTVASTGGFTVAKTVAGDAGASVTSFTGTWTCSAENLGGDSAGTWTLAGGGTTTVAGFPVGTTCSITENTITSETKGTWTSAVDRPSVTIGAGTGVAAAELVTVTNTFTVTPVTGPGDGDGDPDGGGDPGTSGTPGTGSTPGTGGTPGTDGSPGTGGTPGPGGAGSVAGGATGGTGSGSGGVLPWTGSATSDSGSTAGNLATTGTTPAGIVSLALVLVAAGAGAVGVTRLRRRAAA